MPRIEVDSVEKKEKVAEFLNDLGTRIKSLEDLETKLGETVGESVEKYFDSKDFDEFTEKVNVAVRKIEDLENKVEGSRFPNSRAVSVPGLEDSKDAKDFSWQKALYGIYTGNWQNSGLEKEVFDATRKVFEGSDKVDRVLNTGDDSAGGFLVPNEILEAQFIELLRPNIVAMQAGARELNNLSGSPVEIPKHEGSATAAWIGEGQTISASDQSFRQIKLSPKQASALTKMTARQLRLAVPAMDALVREDFAQEIGELIDLAVFKGLGTENQPLGIANTSGINSVNWAPATTTADDFQAMNTLIDMETKVAEDNALRGSLGYVMHPTLYGALKKARDADGRSFFFWDPREAGSAQFQDYPVFRTTQIVGTAGSQEIFFGNFADVLIGFWGGLELRASDQAGDAFAKNQVWLRAIQEVDVALRHAESFCLVNDGDSSKI